MNKARIVFTNHPTDPERRIMQLIDSQTGSVLHSVSYWPQSTSSVLEAERTLVHQATVLGYELED